MTMRPFLTLCSLTLLLSFVGCSTPSGQEPSPGKAQVQIKGVTSQRLQQIIVRHMTDLGYKQINAAPGFLAMERATAQAAPGVQGSSGLKSKVQIAIQEIEPSVLAVLAVEYNVYTVAGKLVEKEALDHQVFMQGLLEGFKAKALYGEPKR
jgi:hypothetical protein